MLIGTLYKQQSKIIYITVTEEKKCHKSKPLPVAHIQSGGLNLGPELFPVPTYLLFKGHERLGRNDVILKIAGYAGKVQKSRCNVLL